MNVGELRAVMDGLPDDLEVMGEWDGSWWLSRDARVATIDGAWVLVIDVAK